MNNETDEKLLDILSGLIAGQRDLLIRVIAAENTLQKHSLAQFEEYEQEKVFAKSQIDMTPQTLALEKLRRGLLQS
jgi:hypothetical protein